MTDEEIRKDIEARVEKAFPCTSRFCHDTLHSVQCNKNRPAARDMLLEYRKAVLEEEHAQDMSDSEFGKCTCAYCRSCIRLLAVHKG